MESPIEVAILVAWCSILAAVVCGGGIFAAASEAWHTSSGDCDHTSGADQVYYSSFRKNPNRRQRRALRRQSEQTLINHMGAPDAKVLQCERRFIILEARIKQRRVKCFVDGGAERSMISRALHEELKLDNTPYKTTIMGVGGAATAVTMESEVPLRLGKKEKQVKALVCDVVPIGDILLAADWLYEHSVTTTHRPPAIWFGGDKTTMIHVIMETPQLKATTTGTVDPVYLRQFAKLFSEPTALPPARRGVDYELRLSARPEPSPEIAVKDPEAITFIREQRDDLLKKGFIEARPSPKVPPAAAFVVFDKNSDSRGASTNPRGKPRVVYDYPKLNAVSELLPPLLPRILDVVRRVAGSSCFSKMDLRAGFHNLRMHPDSVESTAFYFPGLGTYVWKVLPFGIAGAPGAMEALMPHILAEELENEGIEVYLDDILVHAKTKEEHDALLNAVLRRLENNGFHLKAAKCAIPCSEVDFLGYRIRGGSYHPMHLNVQGIIDFAFPTTVKAWQRFHGMVNFYRLHVPRLSDIMKPVTSLFAKKGTVKETPELRRAFNEAKNAIGKRINLAAFNPARPVFLITDASDVAWGALVTHDRNEIPLAWLSKTLSPAEQRWPANERELFAVVSALRRYPELFAGRWVTVLTDNATLTSWANITLSSNRLCKWHEDMQEFMLRFEHLPGKDNPVADALSRGVTETKKIFTNRPILRDFEGKHHEEPRAKTPASANPVILQNGKELTQCVSKDCEAYARGNSHGLCQGCWATAYEKRKSELLGGGVSWQDAANEIKRTTPPGQKRKFTGQFEMRGKRPGGPKETSMECSSYFTCSDNACPHRHSQYRDAGENGQKDKRRPTVRRRRGKNHEDRLAFLKNNSSFTQIGQ